MGALRSFFTGKPDPVIDAAKIDLSSETFSTPYENIVDEESVPPELFGQTSYASPTSPAPRIDRRSAMQVPAVKRSRDIIAGTIGTLPVNITGPNNQQVPATNAGLSLMDQPEKDFPRSVTMTRLVEDLLFEGVAFWRVVEIGWHSYPTSVVRLDPRTVDLRADGRVYHRPDGSPQGTAEEWIPDDQVIRFTSPNAGLLVAGARAIRTALNLDAAAARFSDGVPPLDYFRPADDADLDDDEVQAVLDGWRTARQARATGYVPSGLVYEKAGFNPEQLQMAEARQHAVLEIARCTGIDPEDLGVSTTSRTYFNAFDRKQDRIQSTFAPYYRAIEDRLSMPDVTPRGYRARFDLSELLRSDDLTRYQGYAAGLAVGAIDSETIAAREGLAAPIAPRVPAAAAPLAASVLEPAMTPALVQAAQTFDASDIVTFDAPSAPETFSVDVAKRTIRGLAVPYGVISNDGRTFSFSKGSIQIPADPGRVKLLVGHNWDRAVGKATAFEDTDAGLLATFKVARGAAGDEALSMAEDGVWDGLSVGIGKGMKTRLDDKTGVQDVISASLREVSQTPCPAYDGARITEVAASAHQEGTTMKCTKCGVMHAAGVTECRAEDVATFTAAQAEPTNFAALGETLTQAIAAGFGNLQFPQRETVSASAGGAIEVKEPSPYRFDGLAGEHGFVEDLRAYNSSPEAAQRLETFVEEAFAVIGSNVSALTPTQNRPDLYVPNLTFNRPLYDLVTTGSIVDKTPFTVPKFSSASGLVSDHTEGVEPTPGSFSATNQTITPGAVSGKVEIVREVWDQGGSPQADAIIWQEMLNAYYEAVEAKIAARLASTSTTELNLAGVTNDALVDALTGYYAGLQFVRGGNRFTATAADSKLFLALIGAKGSDGRKLLPVLGPANAQGTTSGGFDKVAVGNQAVAAAWALAQGTNTRSYSFVPSSVWCWTNAPKKFTFEYQVKSIDMALWGYVGTAILRDSDVKPIDFDTSDS